MPDCQGALGPLLVEEASYAHAKYMKAGFLGQSPLSMLPEVLWAWCKLF